MTPSFDDIARRIVDYVTAKGPSEQSVTVVVNNLLVVWNARGAADLLAVKDLEQRCRDAIMALDR